MRTLLIVASLITVACGADRDGTLTATIDGDKVIFDLIDNEERAPDSLSVTCINPDELYVDAWDINGALMFPITLGEPGNATEEIPFTAPEPTATCSVRVYNAKGNGSIAGPGWSDTFTYPGASTM